MICCGLAHLCSCPANERVKNCSSAEAMGTGGKKGEEAGACGVRFSGTAKNVQYAEQGRRENAPHVLLPPAKWWRGQAFVGV